MNPASTSRNSEIPPRDRALPFVFLACAGALVVLGVGFVAVLGWETLRYVRATGEGPFFLTGLAPLLGGSLTIAFGATILSAPLGLLAAIHLSEYATERQRRIAMPLLELLASVPSIVLGWLALRFAGQEVTVVVAVIAVAVMLLPRLAIRCEGVLARVPLDLREAAYSLGATRFEVATGAVLPAGTRGLAAVILLAFSRALGETMIVVLLAGQEDLVDGPIRTLTNYLVAVRPSGVPGVAESVFPAGFVLFAITLGLNLAAAWILRRETEEEH